MQNIRARLTPVIDPPWLGMEPWVLGTLQSKDGKPLFYCLVEADGEPLLRVDLHLPIICQEPRYGAAVWRGKVFLPGIFTIHVFDPLSRVSKEVPFPELTESVLETDRGVVVATSHRVWLLDEAARPVWSSEELSKDSVAIDRVEAGVIHGRAYALETGDWEPFALQLDSGRPSTGPQT